MMDWYSFAVYARDRQAELLRDSERSRASKRFGLFARRRQARDGGWSERVAAERLSVRQESESRLGPESGQEPDGGAA